MKDVINYIKKNYKILLVFYLIFFLTYGIKLTHFSISIDSEFDIVYPGAILREWIQIGRPVLSFLKYILQLRNLNAIFSVQMTFLIFPLFPFFICFLIERISKKHSFWKSFLIGSIILTSPIFLEQLNFTLQSFEISILFLFELLGVYLFELGFEKKKMVYLLGSIMCVTFAFGGYQSFVTLFISLIIILFFTYIKYQNIKNNEIIEYIIKAIGVFIISLILYFIGSKISLAIFHCPSSTYLSNQITWFKEPIKQIILRIIEIIKQSYFGVFYEKNIFHKTIYFLGFVSAIGYCYNIIKSKQSQKTLKIMGIIIILLSPFFLTIVIGNLEAYRAQWCLPLIISFILSEIEYKNKAINKIMHCLIILTIFEQLIISSKLLYSDYNRYNEDVRFAQNIYNALPKEHLNQKSLVFLGYHSPASPSVILKGETIGYSYFEWDNTTNVGVSKRATSFFKYLGYDVKVPNEEEYKRAKNYENILEAFPYSNSIIETDDLIIIKLS